jgi:hypothetical protein
MYSIDWSLDIYKVEKSDQIGQYGLVSEKNPETRVTTIASGESIGI